MGSSLMRRFLPLILALSILAGVGALPTGRPTRTAFAAPPAPPAFVSNCTGSFPFVYHVGPGQPYTSIGAVPFSSLQPGSIVYIHQRTEPYREKIVINTIATPNQPVCIVGVPGPNGELPVIDGQNAVASANMHYDYDGQQQRGLLMFQGHDYGDLPSYIYVEGLHLRNAHPSYSFTTAAGQVRNYTSSAAAVYVQRGQHIRITGCVITDSANGMFTQTSEDPNDITQDIVLEYSYIWGNGIVGSDQQHNTYTETISMTYQFNYFGPQRSGAGGNNIKDRGSGTIIRYNWINSGAHLIDLVECEESCALTRAQPDYNQAWIYGNVLINPQTGYRNTVHWGGDNGGDTPIPGTQACGWGAGEDPTECFHKGPLYFYNNTVIFDVTGEIKTLLRVQTNEQTAIAFNNIIHVIGTGHNITYMQYQGQLTLGNNIVNRSSSTLNNFHSQQAGSSVTGQSNVTVLTNPALTGFVNAGAQDYHLLGTSPAVNTGQALVSGALPLTYEFSSITGGQARANDGQIDQGAFEVGSALPTDTLTLFNPNNGAVSMINTLADLPPVTAYTNFSPGPPVGGQWVMGDWDGDGYDTPGVYGTNGVFYFKNDLSVGGTWSGFWVGLIGRPVVAGRFSNATNDCVGVVDSGNFPPWGTAFALYYTCTMTGSAPPLSFQWLSVVLPNQAWYSGAHQFVAGDFDNDGLDSVAARRGVAIAFTNVAPSQGHAAYNLAQYIGAPSTNDYGVVVSGDWNGDDIDSFGLVYQNGYFYRRNDLDWNTGTYVLQRVGQPIGTPTTAVTWRPGGSGAGSGAENMPQSPTVQSTRIEAEATVVIRSGAWTEQPSQTASAGVYVFSSDLNGALTLEFTGTSIEILYLEGPALGSFTVLIDEVGARTVIATAASNGQANTTLNYLTNEPHVLQIVPIQGTVGIDAFVVNSVE